MICRGYNMHPLHIPWSFKYSHWSLFYICKSGKDKFSVDTKKYNLSTPEVKYIIPRSGKIIFKILYWNL